MGPLNISVKCEYAMLALFDLAAQSQGEPVKISAIARRQRIPQKFLELILSQLKQGGFVESRRGAEGGYLLARRPETITVREVLRYMEGVGGHRAASRGNESPFQEMWATVELAVGGILDQTTVGGVARQWQEKQARYVPNWQI